MPRSHILAGLALLAISLPAAETPAADPAADDRGRGDRMQRMVAENPELKGVDPSTAEGQEKIRQVMQARMRARMAENQAAARVELKKSFAMSDEEFAAIAPLLDRVESLRLQKNLVDRAGMPGGGRQGRNGMGGGPGGPGGFGPPSVQAVLGDARLDPTTQEIQEALKVLKALADDGQSNATELEQAVVRVRAARAAYQAALAKAEEELRGVLTKRQEALLVDRGTLD